MPTITICPKYLSFQSLMVNYLNKYYDHSKSVLDIQMKTKAIRDQLMAKVDGEAAILRRKRLYPLKECTEKLDSSNLTRPCEFVKLIRGMAYGVNRLCYYTKVDVAADYAAERMIKGQKMTLETLETYFEDKCEYEIDENHMTENIRFSFSWDVMHKFYLIFFPLLEEGSESEFRPLMALEEFDRYDLVPEMENIQSMGYVFGHMLNRELVTREFATDILKNLFDDIIKRIGINEVSDVESLVNFLSYFTYGYPLLKDISPLDMLGCNASSINTCQQVQMPQGCEDYCNLIEKGHLIEPTIIEILAMAFQEVNAIKFGSPRSLLPDCTWKKSSESGKCWDSVVIDRGICFTNYYTGK